MCMFNDAPNPIVVLYGACQPIRYMAAADVLVTGSFYHGTPETNWHKVNSQFRKQTGDTDRQKYVIFQPNEVTLCLVGLDSTTT